MLAVILTNRSANDKMIIKKERVIKLRAPSFILMVSLFSNLYLNRARPMNLFHSVRMVDANVTHRKDH